MPATLAAAAQPESAAASPSASLLAAPERAVADGPAAGREPQFVPVLSGDGATAAALADRAAGRKTAAAPKIPRVLRVHEAL